MMFCLEVKPQETLKHLIQLEVFLKPNKKLSTITTIKIYRTNRNNNKNIQSQDLYILTIFLTISHDKIYLTVYFIFCLCSKRSTSR